MLHDAALSAAIARVPLVTRRGPWFRIVAFHLLIEPPPGSTPGSRPRALWPEGASRSGGRFTPRGGFGTVYLAEEPSTALAEVRGVLPDQAGRLRVTNPQPWTIVTIDGTLAGVLDLTLPDVQTQFGTSYAEITAEWRGLQTREPLAPTQQLGRAAYAAGTVVAVRYPSAVAHDGHGLAVFADRLVAGGESYLQVIDPHGLLDQRLPPRD